MVENKRIKRGKKSKVRKDRLLFVALYIGWMLLAGMFITKVTGPAVNLFILGDNHQYAQETYSDAAWEKKDQAYLEYNSYSNELINNDDDIVRFFFSQNTLVKLVIYASAFAPYIILIKFIYDCHQEDKRIKSKKARA